MSEKRIYVVTDENRNADIGNNTIIGDFPEDMVNVRIEFRGENNILYLGGALLGIRNTTIVFNGDNSLIFIRKNTNKLYMNVEVGDNSTLFVGKKIYFNKAIPINIKLHGNDVVYIGDDCLFSLNVNIDTEGGSGVFIGTHVWGGQNIEIKGDTIIENRAVIGADTTVDGAHIPPATCWASRDGKLTKIREGIIFDKKTFIKTTKENICLYDTIEPGYAKEIVRASRRSRIPIYRGLKKIKSVRRRLDFIRLMVRLYPYKVPKWKPSIEGVSWRLPPISDENIAEGEYIDRGNVTFEFRGYGNRLIIEDGTELKDFYASFTGSRALIYICKGNGPCRFIANITSDNVIFIDQGLKTPQKGIRPRVSTSELKSILVGSNCTLGEAVWIRSSDYHGLYDEDTLERLNPAKSTILGSETKLVPYTLVKKGRRINLSEEDEPLCDLLSDIDAAEDLDEKIRLIREYRNVDITLPAGTFSS